ncbi:hypothetical protein C1646_776426 [Rhizophagus diaphanus]|nr:hypothetical protein C1646_776426 [Rhizophagus diaphanus] [Rhizophagus sp. MUCL 43196]
MLCSEAEYYEEVYEKFLELFGNGYLLVLAIYFYEDSFHTTAKSDQELLEILADQAINLDYSYVVRLFYKYYNNMLGSYNNEKMFKCLIKVIDHYNNLGNNRAIIQEYNAQTGKAFILCIVQFNVLHS